MKALLSLLKDYKIQALLAPTFKMIEAILELFVPLVIASLIDEGIVKGSKSEVYHCALLLILLGAIGLGFSVTAQYFSAYVATEASTKLRSRLFVKVQQMSYHQLDEVGTSTLVTRISSDVNQVQTGINFSLRLLLRSPFVVFGAMIMAFFIDVPIALLFVLVIGLLALCVSLIMKHNLPRYKKMQEKLDGLLLRTRQSLMGVRPIRAFGLEIKMEEDFVGENDDLFQKQKRVGNISGLMNPLTFVIVNGGLAIILYLGGDRVDTGTLTQGQMVALVNYLSQILVELVKFANYIITMTKSIACANRLDEILKIPTVSRKGSEKECDKEGLLIFDHVTFQYEEGASPALCDLNLSVEMGEKIGVIGGTGAGKSTLVSLCMGNYAPSKGQICWQGKDILDVDLMQLRSDMALAEQKPTLFSGTIASNLRMGKEDAGSEEMKESLIKAQAYDFVEKLPKGLEDPVEQEGRNFSGGQRQRLSIARALIRKPKLLLLDDCTSALDYATEAAFRHCILTDFEDTTVIWNSQRIAAMEQMDRVLLLDHGRVLGLGTHEQLLADCPKYQEIYASQVRKEASYES